MHFTTAATSSLLPLITLLLTRPTLSNPISSIPESGCGHAVDLIIDACLTNTEPLMHLCAVQDWSCMCHAAESISSCYNNCPSDPNAFGAQQVELSYCNAAKAYPSTTSWKGKGIAAREHTSASSPITTSTSMRITPAIIVPPVTTDPVVSEKIVTASGTPSASGNGAAGGSKGEYFVPVVGAVAGMVLL